MNRYWFRVWRQFGNEGGTTVTWMVNAPTLEAARASVEASLEQGDSIIAGGLQRENVGRTHETKA